MAYWLAGWLAGWHTKLQARLHCWHWPRSWKQLILLKCKVRLPKLLLRASLNYESVTKEKRVAVITIITELEFEQWRER